MPFDFDRLNRTEINLFEFRNQENIENIEVENFFFGENPESKTRIS